LNWPDTEVILRWQELSKAPKLAQCFIQDFSLDHREKEKLKELVGLWRERLVVVVQI